jgi:hypothetical protein
MCIITYYLSGRRRGAYRVSLGNPTGQRLLEDVVVDGRIISKWILKKRDEERHWIDLAQDRDMWRALMKAVMNLRFP